MQFSVLTELPPGLDLTEDGILSGACRQIGVYTIRIRAVGVDDDAVEGQIEVRVGPRF